MYIRGNPDQSIMTTILAFDDTTGRIIVDSSPDTLLNQRLVNAPAVIFDTQVDGININFTAQELEHTTHEGLPAIAAPLPETIRRIQRREFYRVEIPVGEPASCTIPVVERGRPPRQAVVRMKDISVGGLALIDTDNELPHESGRIFRDVVLSLPEVGEATVNLDVLRTRSIVRPNKKEIIELACRFVEPSNATAALIQNYIGRLERRLNAKRRGY